MRTVLKATRGKHSKAISVSQITHFVAEDKYVIAYYPDGVLVLNETLKALETEFADEFIRAHRKALVRRSLISMFKTRPDDSQAGEVLLLGTENWIPVSRSHSAQIKSAMSA
ncbi:TPA: LytTR family transcriptional regulator DNA-binding domain-containing protein [Pseudomonas aeruginosa]|uniref:LytTR family DNA-binding domain-containing protein n=1 Tax=Pseudomonas aeruginosa TaxID=287 RepID=UPI002238B8FF|nr:LytTR family DNA-binding domain-containing protein [Pseudomonas aeruginosa]MCS7921378.1 LytTR family transcriptional regulator [Pseudomonas aeruginosa]MCW5357017.1 LytTR family transcriptional regulator [Pseudomonas aeruginosa]HEJ5496898.1 LytTR family transcriptional regulator [Pseudomonas aeruginosa]HEJ5926991.1 LytTR family transcriptional regulator [Pseudomonas aeruginosa]